MTENRCAVTELHRRAEPYSGSVFGGGEACLPIGSSSVETPSAYRSDPVPLGEFVLFEVVQ